MSNLVPLMIMPFLGKRSVPVFVTVLLLMAVAASGVMSALLPCANSLSGNPYACDGVLVFSIRRERFSVGMWCAAFAAGVIGSSGNLILVPYLSRFRGVFTSAYFAGTGASGVVASFLAAAQVWRTAPREPNFGADVFCAVVAASCSVSLVAWLAVVKLDYDHGVMRAEEAREGRRRARRASFDRPGGRVFDGGAREGGGGISGEGDGEGARDRWRSIDRRAEHGSGFAGPGAAVPPPSPRRRSGAETAGEAAAAPGESRGGLLERLLPDGAGAEDDELVTPGSGAAEAPVSVSCADDDVVDDRAPWRKVAARAWPLVLVNCVAGLANYGVLVPAAEIAATRIAAEASGWAALPTYASITYYVASPFGFGLAGALPPWAFGVAIVTWTVAIALVSVEALAPGLLAATGLGAGARGWALLIVVAVFGLANPYTISEGFRWCQNMDAGERPARWTAVAMQLGSALGAVVSFLVF